jgi:hypothetical protein
MTGQRTGTGTGTAVAALGIEKIGEERDGLVTHGQDGCVCHTHSGAGTLKAGL